MSDTWNHVIVLGPAQEVDRFKRLCLEPSDDTYRDGQSGWDGCQCYITVPSSSVDQKTAMPGINYSEDVWNYQQFTQDEAFEFSFSFDTDHGFPVQLFEHLAAHFPKLAFDCSCIDSMDEFMGFGWFNPPRGGEAFQQDYVVPEDYWTGGGGRKLEPAEKAAYENRVNELREAARHSS